MARELSKPLTQEDIAFLRQRHTEAYVQRQLELYGAEGDAGEARQEAENGPENGSEGSEDPTGQDTGEDAGEGTEEDEEDLIGDLFDPKDHTESEIAAHLKEFPGDKERVLELEKEGRGRKGVLAL